MGIRATAAIVAIMPALLAAQAPVRVDSLKLSAAHVRTLDTIETDDKPWRLAWSPDGAQLYVQILDGSYGDAQTGKSVKLKHYVYSIADGNEKEVDAEPAWAHDYWMMKSNRHAPDAPALALELKSEQRVEQTTQVPRGGDLAKGGSSVETGTTAGDVGAAAYGRQNVTVNFYAFRGERIGEFLNSVVVHGLTFGWGPSGTNALAYAAPKDGKVVVMDDQGRKKEVPGTKHALLPAWSPDATKLAWLEKEGRKKYEIRIIDIAS